MTRAEANQLRATSFLTHNSYDPITGCWNWIGCRDQRGYGIRRFRGKARKVHRISAHLYLGMNIDSVLCVCHHCDNPSCFNPKHLFLGTMLDNVTDCRLKGRKAIKSHCKSGHPLSGDNLRVYPDGKRGYCRQCHRDFARKYYWRDRRLLS
jgi:hypothetical protein